MFQVFRNTFGMLEVIDADTEGKESKSRSLASL